MLDSTIYLLLTTLSLGLLHEHPSLNSEELFTTASAFINGMDKILRLIFPSN